MKSRRVECADISAKLYKARQELNSAKVKFNDEVEALFDRIVKPKIDAYDSALKATNEFVSSIFGRIEGKDRGT
jgi:hypothetical protein